MRKVQIQSLKPGKQLSGDLHDRNGTLLLREGHRLTADMVMSLVRSGQDHVFVGPWDDGIAQRLLEARPLSEYRHEAERLAETLEYAMVRSLAMVQRSGSPRGDSLEVVVDGAIKVDRPESQFDKWQEVCDDGEALVEGVLSSELAPEEVADATRETAERLVAAFAEDRSLLTLLTNLKSTSDYLYRHTLNVTILSIHIATALGYSREQVIEIGMCALLEDVGMALVDKNLVNAPRRLTPLEFANIQRHSVHALWAMQPMEGLPDASRIVAYQCHERADGSGYPQRRSKTLIHRYAQIVAVADVYDALTTDRPWRNAFHPYRAMEFLIRQANMGKFDSEIVRGLLRYLSLYPIGTVVRLSTGDRARVVHANSDQYDRPVVAIIPEANGHQPKPERFINLADEPDTKITSLVNGVLREDLFLGF